MEKFYVGAMLLFLAALFSIAIVGSIYTGRNIDDCFFAVCCGWLNAIGLILGYSYKEICVIINIYLESGLCLLSILWVTWITIRRFTKTRSIGSGVLMVGGIAYGFVGIALFLWICNHYYMPMNVCEMVDKRAEKALEFARKHHMNEHYALFVDYSIPSGTPRLFVWDFQQKKIVATTYVMHGPGKGSTDKRPVFSNEPGSECSSLGRFLVTKEHGNSLKCSFRIKGLDPDNQTAYARGLMIHGSTYLDGHCWMRYIPLHRASCQGCVTISSRGMDYLWRLVNNEKKPLLLWSYYK